MSLSAWKVAPGRAYPMGVSLDADGANFSVFSSVADRVDLCLFGDDGEETRLTLPGRSGDYWHGYVTGVRAGQAYGYRVFGPFDVPSGDLCSPGRLLLDPFTRAVTGDVTWHTMLFPAETGALSGDPTTPETDTGPFVPRSVVVTDDFDWGDDTPPRTPWSQTVIYEAHVKGLTRLHPDVPPELRGTYAGLAHPAVLTHLKHLGVTAVELLPVQAFIHRRRLHDLNLSNYWGYDPIAYFAPHHSYAANSSPGACVNEFKHMVKALHAAGIEVILDVVFNHTGEGGAQGPVLSFKGFDNHAYYRTNGGSYTDVTGTQNTVRADHAHVRRMIIEALRYWMRDMHVDGFRFDLASALLRDEHGVQTDAALIEAINADPVLAGAKMIAEPWDLGDGGYRLGQFPDGWREWNDRYRNDVRNYWSMRHGSSPGLVERMSGSMDLFGGREPVSSINFVTCHDGFTLHDLTAYHDKRNQANGEDNRDGAGDNHSWNCGAEGETDDADVLALRCRQQRNYITTLMLSSGVPMLLAGDEFGRTQRGNNNAYCQDNELSWVVWPDATPAVPTAETGPIACSTSSDHRGLIASLFELRSKFFFDASVTMRWFTADGKPLEMGALADASPAAVQLVIAPAKGDRQSLLMAANPTKANVTFMLPVGVWKIVVQANVDTSTPHAASIRNSATLPPHSTLVLERM